MACHSCDESRKVSGKVEFDLLRTDDENGRYSSQFRVVICPSCGRTEIYCESPSSACEWLGGRKEVSP